MLKLSQPGLNRPPPEVGGSEVEEVLSEIHLKVSLLYWPPQRINFRQTIGVPSTCASFCLDCSACSTTFCVLNLSRLGTMRPPPEGVGVSAVDGVFLGLPTPRLPLLLPPGVARGVLSPAACLVGGVGVLAAAWMAACLARSFRVKPDIFCMLLIFLEINSLLSINSNIQVQSPEFSLPLLLPPC